jgi:phosphotransferase system HPr-like phosphotransfer protein
MANAKYSSLEAEVLSEDEIVLTFTLDDGGTFSLSAETEDVEQILEVLESLFEEDDEDDAPMGAASRSDD